MDGKSYYGHDYLNADTINFANTVPAGSVIKKAFLIGYKLAYYYGTIKKLDNPMPFLFNNNIITIDSTNQVAPYYNNTSPFCYNWMIIKDISNYALFSNNQLITPCQNCLIINNQTNFVYDGFLLVILYENNTMPATNVAVFLNDQNLATMMTHTLNNINPINNSKDVALSINTNYIGDSVLFTLNSSHILGYLRPHANGDITKLPGSFYYQNNTLVGLQDDVNSPFIDTTDALANIKTYIPNNTSSLSLVSQGHLQSQGGDGIQSFILAYSTPCPASTIKDTTLVYSICSGSSKQLEANSNTITNTYNWYATDGSLTTATSASIVVTPTANTTYYVYIDSAGCKQMQRFAVTVNPSPKFDTLYTSHAICGDALGTLTISPAYGGTTMGGPYHYGINMGNQTGNIFTNIAVGTYTATVADAIGCKYAQTFTITEVNNATAHFSISPNPVCINEPVELINTSTGTNLQWWSFGTAVADTSSTKSPAYIYTDTGSYQVILIAYNNLRTCSDTIIKTITVKDCPPDSISITIPNIFSPNADGINEVWQLIVYNYQYTVSNYSCTVYDRWGLKVFSTANISEAWDGRTTSGIACSAGSYYYIIKLTATNSKGVSEVKDFKGFLELVR